MSKFAHAAGLLSMAVVLTISAQSLASDNGPVKDQFTKKGVNIDFEMEPLQANTRLMEGESARVRFRLSSSSNGDPVKGVTPGVWMDMGQLIQGKKGQQKSCKEKIALYLKGVVGIRPMLDLNSYFVLVMNTEPSISVVDPLVSMVGQTSTLTSIRLKGVPSDWVKSKDDKRLYVSMPGTDMVALVDTDNFKVSTNINAGSNPTRVILQPDERYLWVGNDGDGKTSGVTVIDTQSNKPVKTLHTGSGHHQIVFSGDSRYAFVSNRNNGSVTVIDSQTLKTVKTIKTGPLPIAMAYSSLADVVYVSDGKSGEVAVIDPNSLKMKQHIQLKPGLGPIKFSQDGRWAMVVNPSAETLHIIDAANARAAHHVDVPGKPYQVTFSRAFAYVRALESERVTMINLSSLADRDHPIVQGFAAGSKAPALAGRLPLADSMMAATTEAALFVVNPTDNTTYFYMEGMNAPSSNYKVRGSQARAVTVIDRSLKEIQPGLYETVVKLPASGRYDVAFQLETPNVLHCFSAEVVENPAIEKHRVALGIEFLSNRRTVQTGETLPLRFRLQDAKSGKPKSGLKDVTVLMFRAPGSERVELVATHKGDGVYEVMLPIRTAGAYYMHVSSRSSDVNYNDLPYFSVIARPAKTAGKQSAVTVPHLAQVSSDAGSR
ncbi:MAG: cytochrome D1 [Gammaproteobacteria bacterium]|nr:cytochrome D1 [Gammaproteobacteria bacterium]MDH5799960.1 cytochrome D1 [Gammaproteobacteria bacterium]